QQAKQGKIIASQMCPHLFPHRILATERIQETITSNLRGSISDLLFTSRDGWRAANAKCDPALE
ncbi:hypothetical protein STEG23_019590, partial [Scotinomys teguina]